MQKGFTLIELIVVIGIIAILSTIILFSAAQYVNRGKDSNVSGNLAVLIPAGEAYYNVGNTYEGFCQSGVLIHIGTQISIPNSPEVCATVNSKIAVKGLCCNVSDDKNAWAACAQEFTNKARAYCVDSRGVKREICLSACSENITQCAGGLSSCP